MRMVPALKVISGGIFLIIKVSCVSELLLTTLPVTMRRIPAESSSPFAGMYVITGGSKGGVSVKVTKNVIEVECACVEDPPYVCHKCRVKA